MIGTGGMRCRGAGRGIEADFGPEHADTFRRDLHPDLRADYVLANPAPFNDSDWFRKDDDVRWQYRRPAQGQRQLRLGAALHPPPRAPRHGRLRPRQWQHVLLRAHQPQYRSVAHSRQRSRRAATEAAKW